VFLNKVKKTYRYLKLEKEPIVLLGNQKSGTSAIVHLLGKASSKSYTCDIEESMYDQKYNDLLFNKEIPFSDYILNKAFKSFNKKIIKEPSLTSFYNELKDFYPKAQFVFIVRNPKDNIRSILNRVNLDGKTNNVEIIKNSDTILNAWKEIITSNNIGIYSENYIESLALRWNKFSKIYFQSKDNFSLIKYEDFLKNKKEFIENLCNHLGLDVKYDIITDVDKHYQPKGETINANLFFSNDNLNIIEETCYKYMSEFNYI